LKLLRNAAKPQANHLAPFVAPRSDVDHSLAVSRRIDRGNQDMARTQEINSPPDLETTRRRLEECRRRLDRIAHRYGELEEALATLESLAHECFPAVGPEVATGGVNMDSPLPRKPR
jgi:hypothetical protein